MSDISELFPGSFDDFCKTTDLIGSEADLRNYYTEKFGKYRVALIGNPNDQPKQSIDLPHQFYLSMIPDVKIENVE